MKENKIHTTNKKIRKKANKNLSFFLKRKNKLYKSNLKRKKCMKKRKNRRMKK